jgi:hypothetical protein
MTKVPVPSGRGGALYAAELAPRRRVSPVIEIRIVSIGVGKDYHVNEQTLARVGTPVAYHTLPAYITHVGPLVELVRDDVLDETPRLATSRSFGRL